jgi:type VI secretion system protein ImpM
MFGFARRARLEASRSCFGKLPWSVEFLRVNGATPETRLLDDWFQAGLQAMQTHGDWERDFDRLPMIGFWLNFAGSERTLIGGFRASRDQSGRRYPITAFASFDARSLEGSVAVSPLAFSGSYRTAWSMLDGAASAGPIEVLASALTELPTVAAIDDPLHRKELWHFADSHTVAEFCALIGPSLDAMRFDRLVAALAEVLHPARGGVAKRLGWAIVLPLTTRAAWQPLVAGFWLDLIDALLGRADDRMNYFISGATAQPKLVVSFRDPSPRVIAGLATGVWDAEAILEPARMPVPPVYGYAGRTLLETAQSASAPIARLVRASESL